MGLKHIFKSEHVFKDFYCTKTVSKELSVTLVSAFFLNYRYHIRGFDWAISGTVSFLDPEHSSRCIRNFVISHCHCVQTLIIRGRANSYTSLSTLLKPPVRTGHIFFYMNLFPVKIHIYMYIYKIPTLKSSEYFSHICVVCHICQAPKISLIFLAIVKIQFYWGWFCIQFYFV